MKTFDYKCSCGTIYYDHMVDKHDEKVKCHCGQVMKKMITAPNIVGMNSNGSSGSKSVKLDDFDMDSVI